MAAILFASQLRSLFVFPEPNSLRWFGDETWLMSEAHEQISTGIVRYPLAIGSQLEYGKGLVLSMTWLSSVLYGVPVWISSNDLVAVGRIVTAALALLMLGALYGCSRKLGASRFASALAVLLLISTRSFFFASHSARPDVLAGMIVLLVIALGTRYSEQIPQISQSKRWWLGYGMVFMFLAVSSSIHLLTLLSPLALFLFWRITENEKALKSRKQAAVAAAIGALSMLAIFILAYYAANGSLDLFPASSGQFHDVLHSIPILRPFSRSVQVSNTVIRFKQVIAEAPVILILPLIAPLVWKRGVRHTVAIASFLVGLSWLLLEGSEINYLIHLLPIFFLGLALATSRLVDRWNASWVSFAALAVIVFIFGWHDASKAFESASSIDASNRNTAQTIEAQITSTWPYISKPLVLTEPPTLDRLSQDTSIRIMTDHFISFPLWKVPLDSFFAREHLNYAVLYNSPAYPKDRPHNDPFYQDVARSGRLIGRSIGISGDVGRDYFDHSDWQDTILLFKLETKSNR
jgi:hypothetical protein